MPPSADRAPQSTPEPNPTAPAAAPTPAVPITPPPVAAVPPPPAQSPATIGGYPPRAFVQDHPGPFIAATPAPPHPVPAASPFAGQHPQTNSLAGRVDTLEQRLASLERRFAEFERRLSGVNSSSPAFLPTTNNIRGRTTPTANVPASTPPLPSISTGSAPAGVSLPLPLFPRAADRSRTIRRAGWRGSPAPAAETATAPELAPEESTADDAPAASPSPAEVLPRR